MNKINKKKDIKNYTLEELGKEFKKISIQKYRADQIFYWLYNKNINRFDDMINIPKKIRTVLQMNYYINQMSLEKFVKSKDRTEKYLFRLEDGKLIESVLIFSKNRITECISSQVGCKFNCLFCESGKKGFTRNLEVSEMTNQVLFVKKNLKRFPSNIVFMGIGEPLDNYENVIKAIRIFNDKKAFNIGARKITISTCGIIPAVKRLMDIEWQVELSISLHASENNLRNILMPINKKYPLVELIKTCKEYVEKSGRQVTFEYILLQGINDAMIHADRLVKLISNFNSKVNLIVLNQGSHPMFQPSTPSQSLCFKNRLIAAGIPSTIRYSKGSDISAACGQLKSKHLKCL